MAILKADKTTNLGGVTVNEYLLTKHNPNGIDMPSLSMEGKIMGVTIHNTDWITTASDTTPAEQYTRATVNGNMGDVRVHYYVDNTCVKRTTKITSFCTTKWRFTTRREISPTSQRPNSNEIVPPDLMMVGRHFFA